MILKTLKIGLFVIALCSTSLVIGQDGSGKQKGDPEEIFKKLDADANGSVSLEEFKAKSIREASKEIMLDARFKTLDADTNGMVTIE
jgi:Ca2+-binding EF-hand superfamily protein